MSLRYSESVSTEADNLSLRFRTVEQAGILVVTRHDRSQDKLEIVLEGGRVKVSIYIGLAEKSFYVGQSLNDDMYHTLIWGCEHNCRKEIYGLGPIGPIVLAHAACS